jgi:hypothetical protein
MKHQSFQWLWLDVYSQPQRMGRPRARPSDVTPSLSGPYEQLADRPWHPDIMIAGSRQIIKARQK